MLLRGHLPDGRGGQDPPRHRAQGPDHWPVLVHRTPHARGRGAAGHLLCVPEDRSDRTRAVCRPPERPRPRSSGPLPRVRSRDRARPGSAVSRARARPSAPGTHPTPAQRARDRSGRQPRRTAYLGRNSSTHGAAHRDRGHCHGRSGGDRGMAARSSLVPPKPQRPTHAPECPVRHAFDRRAGIEGPLRRFRRAAAGLDTLVRERLSQQARKFGTNRQFW